MSSEYTIREFQELMRELYYEKDSKRGIWKTYAWLVEEIGELSEALRVGDREKLREEIVDVIAWTNSLANLLEIDIAEAVLRKYGDSKCPRCKRAPCTCKE